MASTNSLVPLRETEALTNFYSPDKTGKTIATLFNLDEKRIVADLTHFFSNPQNTVYLEEKKQDFRKIFEFAKEEQKVRETRETAGKTLEVTSELLGNITKARTELHKETKRENKTFETTISAAEEELKAAEQRLTAVQSELKQENQISLFAFTNPLTTKAGRLIATLGRYTFPASIPTLGILHRDTLIANCSRVFSATISAAAECVQTVSYPSVYLPLGIAAGASFLCGYACKIGKRVIEKQKTAEQVARIVQEITQKEIAIKDTHKKKIKELTKKEKTLRAQDQEARGKLEQTTQNLEQAQTEQDRIDNRKLEMAKRLNGENIENTMTLLNTAENLRVKGLAIQADQIVQSAVPILLNSVLGVFQAKTIQPMLLTDNKAHTLTQRRLAGRYAPIDQ